MGGAVTAAAKLKLYDLAGADPARRFSPFCWRARMALAHKGLDVETIPWRYTEKAAIAPSGQGAVPVLVDGGKWIFDSWTIAEYLEAAYPGRPSLFGGGAGRALSRFYAGWADGILHTGIMRFVLLDIWKQLDPRDKDYFRQTREKRVGATLEAFTAEREKYLPGFRDSLLPLRLALKNQDFLGGDKPLQADYIVFGQFQWARTVGDFELLAADDRVAAWRSRLLDLYGGLARKNPSISG
jgi:glutathione S-transferase